MKPTLDDKRDEICVPIAKEIISIVNEHSAELNPLEQDQTKLAEAYKPIFDKFLGVMLAKDVPISYMPYIFGLVQVMFNKSGHYLSLWINSNQDIADAITFDKESSYDVTVADLAKFLDANKDAWLKRIMDSKAAVATDTPIISPIQKDDLKS